MVIYRSSCAAPTERAEERRFLQIYCGAIAFVSSINSRKIYQQHKPVAGRSPAIMLDLSDPLEHLNQRRALAIK